MNDRRKKDPHPLVVRTFKGTTDRLDRLARQIPFANRSDIVRRAMEYGLAELERRLQDGEPLDG